MAGQVRSLRIGLWLLAAAFAANPAAAQPAPVPASPVIVIADVNQILRDAKSAKDVQSQIDKEMVAYSKEVSAQETELQKMRADLEHQRGTLSADAFSAKTQQYQQRFDALDHNVQVRRQALQQSFTDAMGKVESTALEVITEIAAERKANLVLTRAAVLFEAGGFDITAEVLKRLDAKLPSLTVNLPPADAASKPGAQPAASPKR
jgi:Skp family chaperone for outer membrane proteins